MLLFIETSEMDYGYTHLFQYISCCYLSFFNLQRLVDKGVSIHLMLLFINYKEREKLLEVEVSIHLMLLFIRKIMGK